MRHLLNFAIITFLMVGTVSAQHINIGIKGGLNLYTIANDNSNSNEIRPAFNAGILGHIHLASQWALQPEVVFSAQGANYTVGELDAKLKLNYINVPVLIQYMFDNGFRLEVGPQLGVLISAKSNINDINTDVKSTFKTVEFGLGAGASYVSPKSGIGVDIRFNLGLSNINENTATVSTNRGVQAGVFYLFDHQ